MPTLEERNRESETDLQQRLYDRQRDLGVSHNFSEYIEMMEKYLLQLERRVSTLERKAGINNYK